MQSGGITEFHVIMRRLLKILREISHLPKVRIELGNEPADAALFYSFSRRHPRLFIIGNKTIGVGLIDCRRFNTVEEYTASVNGKNSAAYFSRKAIRSGYRFDEIDAIKYSSAIHDIHLSSTIRQGIPMAAAYQRELKNYPMDHRNQYFGIFKENKLVAYLWIVRSGQVVIINRIMGHVDYLKEGVMYLLVTSFVEQELSSVRSNQFIMYDTIFGASAGLRMFKERCGFIPMHVTWERRVG